MPFTVEQARIARVAYQQFGRGSGHPARLNMGDCFAYALARDLGEPLLFKGGDFALTDIEIIVEPVRSRRLSEVVASLHGRERLTAENGSGPVRPMPEEPVHEPARQNRWTSRTQAATASTTISASRGAGMPRAGRTRGRAG